MLQTAIIIGERNKILLWHPLEGFAKSVSVARWLFDFCGWNSGQEYPDLAIVVSEIDCEELEGFFDYDHTQLFVLGSCLHLN